MTLLAAFQVLLYRYSGQEDIAVGTPIAGRGRTETGGADRLLRQHAGAALGPRRAIRRFASCWRGCARARWTPTRIRTCPSRSWSRSSPPARDLSRNPLFQVMFVLQNAPDAALALEGVQASRLPLAGTQRQVRPDADRCARRRDGLHARWEYSTDLFDAATIERMARHFRHAARGHRRRSRAAHR